MRRLLRLSTVSLLGPLLVGCGTVTGPVDATTQPPSGISGTVILGPTCPTDSEPGAHDPVPCLTPYSAQLVILDADSTVVARTSSSADGSFRVDLPPGDYVVAPQGGDPFPIAQPVEVSVVRGSYVEIQVNYDTGIR